MNNASIKKIEGASVLVEQIKHLAGIAAEKAQGADIEAEILAQVVREKAELVENILDGLIAANEFGAKKS